MDDVKRFRHRGFGAVACLERSMANPPADDVAGTKRKARINKTFRIPRALFWPDSEVAQRYEIALQKAGLHFSKLRTDDGGGWVYWVNKEKRRGAR